MRSRWLLLLGCLTSSCAWSALYKHVDEAGKVTYSDRPQHSEQQALNLPPPNVATPEARRQLDIARQAWNREEQEEYEARLRRMAASARSAPTGAYQTSYGNSRRYGGYGYVLPYHVVYARSPTPGHSSQGLHAARVSHRAGSSRR